MDQAWGASSLPSSQGLEIGKEQGKLMTVDNLMFWSPECNHLLCVVAPLCAVVTRSEKWEQW